MYLQKLTLTNTGPIEHAEIECKFDKDGNPKPIVFVGKNGSGKSFAIAHLVNALASGQSRVFEDSDIKEGRVFKFRSPQYVRYGSNYSFSEVTFSNNFFASEIQLTKLKNEYPEPLQYKFWNEIKDNEISLLKTNFFRRKSDFKEILNKNTYIYFPPNRFESPSWLNETALQNRISYPSFKNLNSISNRPLINDAPLRDLQNWLLDLIYDVHAIENKNISHGQVKYTGQSFPILNSIAEILTILFSKYGRVEWSVGPRNFRKIAIYINNELVTNNLFGLSSGETVLLDLFLTIIRDFDLSKTRLRSLEDIQGIVIVDEIDLHLHSDLQHDLLPKLIKLFPKVQFVLTTHSPLFLMGMDKAFPENSFQLIELPSGMEIDVERFSEFEKAYNYLKDSSKFVDEVHKHIKASKKPLIYLEGDTDIDYLKRAAEVLDKSEFLKQFELREAGGASGLNKIWNNFKPNLIHDILNQNCLLLYDCDQKFEKKNNGRLYREKIPFKKNHIIKKGVENLFSKKTIETAKNHKPAFIDIHESKSTIRGVPQSSHRWEINKDEKRNLCDWICDNGTAKDFEGFSLVFEILEHFLHNE